MDFSEIPLAPVLIFVGIVIYAVIKNGKTKRKIKSTVLKPIKDCDGSTEEKIVAKVIQVSSLLNSPLNGKPCVYYEVIVKTRVDDVDGDVSYESIIEEKSDRAFYVEDATGLAKIQPARATFESEDESFFSSSIINQPHETHLNFLDKHNIDPKGFLNMNKTLIFVEKIIELGDALTVVGKGSWGNVGNNQIQTKHKKIFTIRKEGESVFILSN